MTEEILNIPTDTKTLEYHLVNLFEKLEDIRRTNSNCLDYGIKRSLLMKVEIRSLEFWRSIISECLASFFYVFIVCGAAAGVGGIASPSSILLATSLSAGFCMTTLTQCFGHISGAHVNPAVTLAMLVTKNVSAIRALMFMIAQCGGAIAGAALLYGVTMPAFQSNLSAAIAMTANVAPWERFGIEIFLTFIVVFTYFVSMDSYRKWMGSSALMIGSAYSACSFVSMPYLNPARSLGPSFVLNKWDNHWVYWFGPLVGGLASGLIYEFIFNPKRHTKCLSDSTDDSSSMHSDEDTYDDLDKPPPGAGPKYNSSTYNSYKTTANSGLFTSGNGGGATYCPSLASASLYSVPPPKLNRVESLYGGTKSLYCKSPPLTRANLNRSQSVYTKSNSAVNKDILPRPGPLVPAQSLYPMRLNQQQTHVQNQNVQNQIQHQQCTEGLYSMRTMTNSGTIRSDSNRDRDRYAFTGGNNSSNNHNGPLYAGRNTENNGRSEDNQPKCGRGNRPDSMYGMLINQQQRSRAAGAGGVGPANGNSNGGAQSVQSDDSTYSSYHGSNPTSRTNTATVVNNYYSGKGISPPSNGQNNINGYNCTAVAEGKQSPSTQQVLSAPPPSYHHSRPPPQHSPNSQY